MSALHIAVFCGHWNIVRKLVEAGANISLQVENGMTAHDIAVVMGHNEIAELLRSKLDIQPAKESVPARHLVFQL